MKPTRDEYERLLEFRLGIRRFLHWSELRAEEAGLTAAQHQLLLVVVGSEEHDGPTIGQISDALMLKHHSTVELVDRAERAGLVLRQRDTDDRRVVRIRPTPRGRRVLEKLTIDHLRELKQLAPALQSLLRTVSH